MILMGRVPAAVVNIVHVVTVRHAHVSATFAVPVRVIAVLHVACDLAFVGVCLM